MTAIVSAEDHHEREAAGETTLELVAVRYTGEQTLYDVEAHLVPAGWPGSAPLDGGPTASADGSWNFALVPDEGLAALEGRPDLEVVYGDQRERFADILLGLSRLPENVFGRGADIELQRRVFDDLGLEPTAKGGPFEEQLRALTGAEASEEADEDPDPSPEEGVAGALVDEYDRSELGDIAKELRSDPSEFNLRENATKTERAEFIAGFDRDERAAAVEAALGGED